MHVGDRESSSNLLIKYYRQDAQVDANCITVRIINVFMNNRKEKKYHPNPKLNPIVMQKRIDKLGEEIEHHKALLDTVNKANDLHVEQLSNFVRHDMKNAILGLNGILYNAKLESLIPQDIQKELDTAYELIRLSLDNFTELIPSTQQSTTTLPKILNAIEMLSRSYLKSSGVSVIFDYDRQSKIPISYSFQTLVQVIHNLVINAHHALYGIPDKKIYIKADISSDKCEIRVYDNAAPISDDVKDKIFYYGFSTTGGTGIGLFHAREVLSELNGVIDYYASDISDYVKYFVVKFNIQ